ncbi:MAG TPA: hypothetical protein VLV83_19115 [Acidobacteriota bacterium]|nr:hypothetical protein [Acidobacteriota bacterium]
MLVLWAFISVTVFAAFGIWLFKLFLRYAEDVTYEIDAKDYLRRQGLSRGSGLLDVLDAPECTAALCRGRLAGAHTRRVLPGLLQETRREAPPNFNGRLLFGVFRFVYRFALIKSRLMCSVKDMRWVVGSQIILLRHSGRRY